MQQVEERNSEYNCSSIGPAHDIMPRIKQLIDKKSTNSESDEEEKKSDFNAN